MTKYCKYAVVSQDDDAFNLHSRLAFQLSLHFRAWRYLTSKKGRLSIRTLNGFVIEITC